METTIKLVPRGADFATIEINGRTISYLDPVEATEMLEKFFGLDESQIARYYAGELV